MVNAHNFISKLPNKYQEIMMERGNNLSVGQKQLLSFARVLIYNPKILVLDEATSSVDPESESLIKDALAKIMKGRTSIIIAHRLSTIKNADKIIVIEDGRVAGADGGDVPDHVGGVGLLVDRVAGEVHRVLGVLGHH